VTTVATMSEPTPPSGVAAKRSHGPVLLLACGATFLAMLDATVANLALPDLRGDFADTPVTQLSWVISLYAILVAALLTPAGRLADVVGRRRLYVAGVGLFTAMSLLCAVAPTLGVLLSARALQGAGAAAMIPASLAILLVDSPPERRAGAIGLWSAAGALAAAVGPSVGGVLVDAFGWRSVFLINLPVGLVLARKARGLPAAAAGGRLPDLAGGSVLAGGIALLVLGVTQGPAWHWGDARTVAALLAGAAALAVALARAARHPVPALEIGLWRSRTYAMANLTSLLYGAALYAWLLTGVLFLTQVWGYSELQAGLAMTPGAVAAAAAAVAVGRRRTAGTARAAVAGGGVLFAAVGLWLAVAVPEQPHLVTVWIPAGILVGAAMGALTTGISSAAALSVKPPQFAVATGLNLTARQFGGALGIAVMAVILQTRAGIGGFRDVYVFCGLLALGAAGSGLGLRIAAAPAQVGRPASALAQGRA
jgi:EmrB/QacA subfamily drug resistance transporter